MEHVNSKESAALAESQNSAETSPDPLAAPESQQSVRSSPDSPAPVESQVVEADHKVSEPPMLSFEDFKKLNPFANNTYQAITVS
jgi:hypothetical protein